MKNVKLFRIIDLFLFILIYSLYGCEKEPSNNEKFKNIYGEWKLYKVDGPQWNIPTEVKEYIILIINEDLTYQIYIDDMIMDKGFISNDKKDSLYLYIKFTPISDLRDTREYKVNKIGEDTLILGSKNSSVSNIYYRIK